MAEDGLSDAAPSHSSLDLDRIRQYDVALDGRFLINAELDSATAPITLLMNGKPAAKK